MCGDGGGGDGLVSCPTAWAGCGDPASKHHTTSMPPKAKGKGEVNEAGQAGASKWGRVKTNLKMGVVGLPNVGKSSLFNLLTEQGAAADGSGARGADGGPGTAGGKNMIISS